MYVQPATGRWRRIWASPPIRGAMVADAQICGALGTATAHTPDQSGRDKHAARRLPDDSLDRGLGTVTADRNHHLARGVAHSSAAPVCGAGAEPSPASLGVDDQHGSRTGIEHLRFCHVAWSPAAPR